ncbi:hypothetical protein F5Y15DRAFT_417823 [Xylariaceae sp. FL0016]|nr:hypothetical protein F5Y15DRAFT_417823 [Xylariaceae sp. FL0016]
MTEPVAQNKFSPINGEKKETLEPPADTSAASNVAKPSEDDDTANEAELSPPPDSSSVSSVNPDMLGDEIIVGTNANGDKQSPPRNTSDPEDGAARDAEDEGPMTPYPKRKRSSVYNDLAEDKMDPSMIDDIPDDETGSSKGQEKSRQSVVPDVATTHVTLGQWRDSAAPLGQKHAVVGFIDVRERLRTRTVSVTLSGEPINNRLFPLPSGPGGRWVTFERIIFKDHLVGLDHNVVKEYVRVKIDIQGANKHEPGEETDLLALDEAKRRLKENPPPETQQPPPIAWGAEVPENAVLSRGEVKRRRMGSAAGIATDRASASAQIQPQAVQSHTNSPTPALQSPGPPRPQVRSRMPQPHEPLTGTRPTRILVGSWIKSSAEEKNRHAVYGILGANDMFRVKLVRETLDGRYIDGNFPIGAGALWISYEDVQFLAHIAHLARPEMKEYVRVRQWQIDAGETEADRVANETKAVYDAQARAAANPKAYNTTATPRQSIGLEMEDLQDTPMIDPAVGNVGSHELRQNPHEVIPRRERHELPSARPHPHTELELRQAEVRQPEIRQASRHNSNDPLERVQSLASREVARMEAVQTRNDRHNHNRGSMGPPPRPAQGYPPHAQVSPDVYQRSFEENRKKLQSVWLAQENNHVMPEPNEAKIHNGIKYERKQNGPFAGKLVSQGAIITIDGEDYVEYRVLTKPSFF